MPQPSERVLDLRQRLADAVTGLEEQRVRLAQVRRDLDEAEASVTSRDHSVTATVGARGDLIGLRFHGARYRSMAPAELADTIVAAVAQARTEMAQRVADAFRPHLPSGSDLAERMAGVDLPGDGSGR